MKMLSQKAKCVIGNVDDSFLLGAFEPCFAMMNSYNHDSFVEKSIYSTSTFNNIKRSESCMQAFRTFRIVQ
jgi:hypothetical protein